MTNNPNNPESLDPRLKALLDELRPAPERDPKVAAQGKANFMAEVDNLLAAHASLPKPSFTERVRQKWSVFSIGFGQRRTASFAAVVVVLVLIFGGAGMTAVAAQAALPGDALYSVKTGLEGTRASLTGSAANQVSLYLQFAERRLAEIEKLIAEGRYADIQLATQEFDTHIQNALASLSNLAAGDPAQASSLALQITEALARYAQALATMSAAAPEPARLELEKAIQTSAAAQLNSLPGSEVEFTGQVTSLSPGEVVVAGQPLRLTAQTELKVQLQVGLLVKVHARRGPDGALEAREIELAGSQPGNQNQNGSPDDAIGNSNQNGDDNQNESGNQNANDNSDDRQEDSGNGNQNLNANDDDSHDNQVNSNDNQPGDDSNDNDNQNDDDSNDKNDNDDNDQKDDNNKD